MTDPQQGPFTEGCMRNTLVYRLEQFAEAWLSNPVARLDFAKLVSEVLQHPRADHADAALQTWVDEERACARRIGLR